MSALAYTEKALVEQVARYLQTKYPQLIYRFDLAADLKLTTGQAARHKRLHPMRGYPDLFIARQGDSHSYEWDAMGGLFIELKREGTRIKKRDGSWANEHIAEQAAVLEELRNQGYAAEFAVGLDQTIQIIENYLGGS